MRLIDLAHTNNLSLESLQSFIFDFGVDINQVIDNHLKLQEGFINFVKNNEDFLKKYGKDYGKPKSIDEIAKTIDVHPDEIIAFFKRNGLQNIDQKSFKTNVSSYLIHIYLGGNYDFIYDDLKKIKPSTPKTLVGYSDLFFHITGLLEPFITQLSPVLRTT